MARQLRTERIRVKAAETASTRRDGLGAFVDIPVIPSDAGPVMREGLSRRRYCARKGTCRCGATRHDPGVPQVQEGDVLDTSFPHAPDCPAHSDILGPEIEAWANTGEVPGACAG